MSAEGVRLTKAQRKALEWFNARAWADRFGEGDPSLTLVKRLVKAGLVARMVSRASLSLTKFHITVAGRAALTAETGGRNEGS